MQADLQRIATTISKVSVILFVQHHLWILAAFWPQALKSGGIWLNLGVGHWGQKWYIQRYTKHLTVFLSPWDFLKHGHKFQLWRSHRHVDDEWIGVLRGYLVQWWWIASYGECSKLSLPWFNDGHHLFIHKVSRINCGVAMKFLPWFCCMPCSSILALSLFFRDGACFSGLRPRI